MDPPPFFTGGRVPKNMCDFSKKIFFSLFPPFVAQFFLKIFLSKSKNSFKNGFPTGGVSPKICAIFPKKILSFLPAKIFFKNFFCQNRKIPSKMDCPPFFYGVPNNRCDFFQKIFFFVVPASRRRNFFSKFRQAKFSKIFFSKSKNSSIFELPDPKIGGGVGHFGSGRSSTFNPV